MALNNAKINVENIETKREARVENNTKGVADFFAGFIRPQAISEYVRKFKDTIIDSIKDQNLFEIKILAFDNQSTNTGWAYSFVVIAGTRPDTDKVFYMPFLLEATGREPVAINAMLETDPRTGLVRVKDPALLFTPSDYFNKIIIGEIEKSVANNFPGKEPKYVDGEVVPYNADVEKVAPYAAIDALGGMYVLYGKTKGIYKDLNVANLIDAQTQVFADLTLNSGLGINMLNRTSAVDFIVKLYTKKQQRQQQIPGIMDETNNLGGTSGFVEETIISEPDNFGRMRHRAVPILIAHDIDTKYPTMGYTLLNLANIATLNQPSVLSNLLYNKPNVGAMNFLCNLEGNEGYGSIVNIKDKKYTYEKAMAYINKLFVGRAASAVEIELNGREYFKVSPFVALIDPNTWQQANNYIVTAAETLVGKQFQNRLCFRYAIEVPVGEWVDNSGTVRDLREIDLATVISLTKDVNIIHKWLLSNDDPKVSQVDPYLTKIEVYNKLGLNAKIHNKAVRVYLDPNFMAELISGLEANRFTPILNANITYTNFADLSSFGTSSIAAAMLNTSLGATPGYAGQGYQYQNYGYVSSGFFM